MRNEDRAKQFMPFAALKGYEELIEESEQPTPTKTPGSQAKPTGVLQPTKNKKPKNLKKP
jgi:hypothetical protein